MNIKEIEKKIDEWLKSDYQVSPEFSKGIKILFKKALQQTRKETIEEVIKCLPKEKETCNCGKEFGYHSKDCTFENDGFNKAIKEIETNLKKMLEE